MSNVTFYAGNTLQGIAKRILADLPEGGDKRHVLLVPDRDTLAMEETLANRFGVTFNVEVLTFARLAVMVLGGAAWDCLTPEGCTMLLSKALYRIKDELTFYKYACETQGFANEMYSALVAIRESGISAEALLAAAKAENVPQRTKDKMQDLAKIYSEYLSVLSTQLDPTTRLEQLVKAIPDSAEIALCNFYILDFYCFNHVQYEVIKALMAYASSVRIGFISESVGKSNKRIYPADMRHKLYAIARECGINPAPPVAAWETLPYHKKEIEARLFGYEEKAKEGLPTGESIRLFCAADTMDELRTVCAEICKLVREEGYRYRDIAIVCAEGNLYDDVFRAVFDEYKVPYFRDTKVLLSEEPVVRFLLDGLDCERQKYGYESVMKVVKNAFFKVPTEDVHYFENYCLKYNINYSRFLSSFALKDEEDDIERAEAVRLALSEARIPVEGCSTVGDYVDAIDAFMKAYDIEGLCAAFRQKQADRGFREGAKRSEQVMKRLEELLSLMKRLLSDEEADIDKFVMLLRSSLDSVHISLLPQSSDCVYIGEAKDSRYDNVRAMFVVGAADGVLPEVPQAGSILSDAFCESLKRAGGLVTDDKGEGRDLTIYPTAKDEGLYAMFYLEQLLLIPEERLYVSYCARKANNERQYPSVLVDCLAGLFDIAVTDGLGHTVAEQAANRENAYKVLLRMHGRLSDRDKVLLETKLRGEDDAKYKALFETSEQELPATLGLFFNEKKEKPNPAGHKRYLTSISQLETYFACPYQHFVKYGLRAKERQDNVLDVRETGSLLHEVLEKVLRALYGEAYAADTAEERKRRCDQVEAMSEAEVDRVTEACLEDVLKAARYKGLNASERKVQLDRVRNEALIVVRREMALAKISRFKPCEFEVKFCEGGDYPAIQMDEEIYLTGKIDRIDRREASTPEDKDEYMVIDYKTGTVHIELSSVYYGTKVQIYAYLGALKNDDNEPIGAFYKKVTGAYEKEDTVAPAGALLGHPPKDADKLREIDPTLGTGARTGLLTVVQVVDKTGKVEWKNKDKGGTMLGKGELEGLMDYVMRVMQGAVDEIRGGYIEAKPIEEYTCEKCAARNMCANISKDVRETKKVDITSFGGKL